MTITTTSTVTNSTILPTSTTSTPLFSPVDTANTADIVSICNRIGIILNQLKSDESPLSNPASSQTQSPQAEVSEIPPSTHNLSLSLTETPPLSVSSMRIGAEARSYKNTVNDITQLLSQLSQKLPLSTDADADSRDNTKIAEELGAVLQMLSASKEGMDSLVEKISGLQTAHPLPLSPSLTQRLISWGVVMTVILAIVVLVAVSMTGVILVPAWLSSTLTLALAMTPQLVQQMLHLIDIRRTYQAEDQAQGQAQSKMQLWQLEKWLDRLQNQLQLTHQKTQQELTIARQKQEINGQKQEIIELKRTVDSLIKTIDNLKNIPIISKSLNSGPTSTFRRRTISHPKK